MAKNMFCTRRKRASSGDHVKKISEFFFGWIRKVFSSLDQGNLVCSNRIYNNRSTVYPFLPKMDVITVFAFFRCFLGVLDRL